MRRLSLGCLMWSVACGSSSGPPPADPLAMTYCAACSELAGCESVVTEALSGVCPDETRAWYTCVEDSACDDSACTAEWTARLDCMGRAPEDAVRAHVAVLRPSANLGHRGTGPTREGHPFPENSVSSFTAAIDDGADGVELDAAITKDGEIIIMHDDMVDRTTDCTGCVSELTFDEIRACRLLDGAGVPTGERPPTLREAYSAVGSNALVNVELKVFEPPCLTDATGPDRLVPRVLEEVTQLGTGSRTIFSSFDTSALAIVKADPAGYYSALLSLVTGSEQIDQALELGVDAIHPFATVSNDTVQAALEADLQVSVWVVDDADSMQAQIDKGATAIITDEPAILAELLGR